MNSKIYSIRDTKGEIYNTPFFQKTHGEAERSFRQLVSDEKTLPGKYPDDFDLYYIGDWDDQTGSIKPLQAPQHMLKANSIPEGPRAQKLNLEAARPQ